MFCDFVVVAGLLCVSVVTGQAVQNGTVANPTVSNIAPTQVVSQPPAATAAPTSLDILGLVKSLTPCATTCLAKLPAVLGSINLDSSSGLSSEAAQICAQNKDLIAQCAVTCQSDILTQLTASCASVGALNGGTSPLSTVRTTALPQNSVPAVDIDARAIMLLAVVLSVFAL
ncbi:UNVERIFIED_CONTAM: hypothetical protein HDU68_012821 [Siphonaria sp. JEL0065]|nr:hypothetical protein HDU68_012821 [Siphonaria sp. JEL0065]